MSKIICWVTSIFLLIYELADSFWERKDLVWFIRNLFVLLLHSEGKVINNFIFLWDFFLKLTLHGFVFFLVLRIHQVKILNLSLEALNVWSTLNDFFFKSWAWSWTLKFRNFCWILVVRAAWSFWKFWAILADWSTLGWIAPQTYFFLFLGGKGLAQLVETLACQAEKFGMLLINLLSLLVSYTLER